MHAAILYTANPKLLPSHMQSFTSSQAAILT